MTDYIELPIETDPGVLAQEAFDYLATRIVGWLPSEGNLDVWMLEAIAQMAAELRDVASAVPVSIFRHFGQTLIGLPPINGVAAQFTTQWNMRDALGHTIPAGTKVIVRDTSGTAYGYTVLSTVNVIAPATATAAGGVTLVADDLGAGLTGYTPPDSAISLVDNLEFVSLITGASIIAGGVDAETDDAYLSRLSAELKLLTPRPILPNDFAVLSLLNPSVGRALAIDGYNPADTTFNNARMVAVAVTDAAGAVVSAGVKTAVGVLLASYREVTFIVNVIDPTYNTITVVATVKAIAGFDLVDVDTRVTAAINEFLSPANWGLPLSGDTPNWVQSQTVRYLDMANVIKEVEGVNYIVSMTINAGVVDIALTGVAPLTQAGVTNVTVT